MDLASPPPWAGLAGYLVGSVNFALLVARRHGVDLRAVGSGNPGATNVGRALGRGWGMLVYLLDALKGAAPAALALALFGPAAGAAAGGGAFVGHVLPLWHRFHGGKGVATLSGAMLVLAPLATLSAGLVWLVVYALTRTVGMGSVAFGLALGPSALLHGAPRPVLVLAFAGGLALLVTHRSNLRRFLAERRAAGDGDDGRGGRR